MDVGSQLLLSLVQHGHSREFVRYQLTEALFYGAEVDLYRFVHNHIAKHHQLPKPETVLAKFPDLGKAGEPPGFYLEQVEQRHAHKRLNGALLDANKLMKDHDTWAALDMVEEVVGSVRGRALAKDITDFGHSTIVQDEVARIKLMGEDPGIKMGWDTFDTMTGGLRGGDVVSIVGRMAMGKSWFLFYAALYAWWKQSKNTLVVSMEMDVLSVAQRVMSMMSKVNAKHLRLADLTTVEISRLAKATKGAKALPGHLWIMDGNLTAEVDQIFTVAHQQKVDAVYIDGAYLLAHPDRKLDKFRRVDANIELIKRRAANAGIPVINSYQFNRKAVTKWKGLKNEGGGLEDIAYSDAIGQISSAVLALQQEDTVEAAFQRLINVIKCRTEKQFSFNVKWDFHGMDFGEVIPEKVSDLKFV